MYFFGVYVAWFFIQKLLELAHDLMASIWEKEISILGGNLNSGRTYIIILLQLYIFFYLT